MCSNSYFLTQELELLAKTYNWSPTINYNNDLVGKEKEIEIQNKKEGKREENKIEVLRGKREKHIDQRIVHCPSIIIIQSQSTFSMSKIDSPALLIGRYPTAIRSN